MTRIAIGLDDMSLVYCCHSNIKMESNKLIACRMNLLMIYVTKLLLTYFQELGKFAITLRSCNSSTRINYSFPPQDEYRRLKYLQRILSILFMVWKKFMFLNTLENFIQVPKKFRSKILQILLIRFLL